MALSGCAGGAGNDQSPRDERAGRASRRGRSRQGRSAHRGLILCESRAEDIALAQSAALSVCDQRSARGRHDAPSGQLRVEVESKRPPLLLFRPAEVLSGEPRSKGPVCYVLERGGRQGDRSEKGRRSIELKLGHAPDDCRRGQRHVRVCDASVYVSLLVCLRSSQSNGRTAGTFPEAPLSPPVCFTGNPGLGVAPRERERRSAERKGDPGVV